MLLFENEFIEDGEYFFAIGIHLPERIPETLFVALGLQPAIEHRPWHVNVAPQGIRRVAAQEETVKNRCLALRS